MELNEDTYRLIDQYLAGELSGAELKKFETALENNADLRKEVEMVKTTNSIFFYNEATALKETMKNDFKSLKRKKNIKIASSIAIGIAVLTTLYLLTNSSEKTDKPVIKKEPTVITKEVPFEKKSIKSSPPQPDETATNSVDSEKSIEKSHDNTAQVTTLIIEEKPTIEKQPEITKQKIQSVKDTLAQIAPLTETKEEKPTPTTSIVDPCKDVVIKGSVKTKKTAADQNNGEIMIDLESLKGGGKPYQFSIDNNYYSKGYVFKDLPKGSYTVFIRDNNNCESKLNTIEVAESMCLTDYIKTFNPTNDLKWLIPHNNEANADYTLTVYSNSGETIFSKDLDTFSDQTWDGITNQGNIVTAGYYKFIIEYSNETCKGDITIFH